MPADTDIRLHIPPDAWEQVGPHDDPRSHLLCQVTIDGCPMHAEAYRTWRQGGMQHYAYEEDVVKVRDGVDAHAPWDTVRIFGDHYVLIVTPHCD